MRALQLVVFSAAVCGVVACVGEDRTNPTAEALSVAPADIDLGLTWVGHPERLTLQFSNRSRADGEALVHGGGPHTSLEPITVAIPAGGTIQVDVVVLPTKEGSLEEDVIHVEGIETPVVLSGVVAMPPECDRDEPCGVQRFSPGFDGCIWAPKEDGTACADLCVVDGFCAGGVCKGLPRACPDDDGDACTVPACSPLQGCLLVPRSCKASSACVDAKCDPKQGCVETPVADGTFCGEPNCDQDHICIAGACVSRQPPDDRLVTRCLRASQVAIPEGAGIACAVSDEGEGVCWGSVRSAFGLSGSDFLAPDYAGPFLANLGPAAALFGAGTYGCPANRVCAPLVLQRPDGETLYVSASDGSENVFMVQQGMSGRGLHTLPMFKGATSIAGFPVGLCGVTPDEELRCEGADEGDPTIAFAASQPALSTSVAVKEVSGGRGRTCARLANGGLTCRTTLALDSERQKWCTTNWSHASFEPLSVYPPVDSLSVKGNSGCAVTVWGEVYCDGWIRLAGAPEGTCHGPLPVADLDGVTKVRIGGGVACALRHDGTVWCWGTKFPEGSSLQPRPIPGLDHVVDFDLQNSLPWQYEPLLCAVRSDGLIKCLGGNRHGEAGVFQAADGGTRPRRVTTPTAISLPDAGLDLGF